MSPFQNDAIVFGILMLSLGFVFYTESKKNGFWSKFYKIVPGLLMCYFLPAIFNSLGIISSEESNTYFIASRYLLPAALLLMTQVEAEKKSIEPLAKIISWASVGVEPSLMGLGPIEAVRVAVRKANWKIDEIDLFEINEAFAAQSIAVINELKIDKNKVNVNGGAIALGHPIGASGARILVTLLHEMKKQNKKKGCATLCIGGGMGIALCVERD